MDAVFHALAHDARRAMLRRLAGGALTVGELAGPLAMSLAAASKHVRVLERAGLLHRTVDGRRHVCRLTGRPARPGRRLAALVRAVLEPAARRPGGPLPRGQPQPGTPQFP